MAFFQTGSSWYNFFKPSQSFAGGTTVNVSTPLSMIPVLSRSGAIVPLNVTNSDVGNGDCSFAGSLTLLVHSPNKDGAVVSQVRVGFLLFFRSP